MANKKMGRPTSRKKDCLLKVRVNETDLKLLDELASMYHINRSVLVRNILWYFIDNNADNILQDKIDFPIDEVPYNGVLLLYELLGNNDEDYLDFKKEMEKRRI